MDFSGFQSPANRLTHDRSAMLNALIKKMVLEGVSVRQISKALCVPRTTISGRVHRMRKTGELPKWSPMPGTSGPHHMAKALGRKLGNMSDLFRSISQEESQWLMETTPTDGRVTDLIASIISDAYFEEKHGV